jgi:hypothetical protein
MDQRLPVIQEDHRFAQKIPNLGASHHGCKPFETQLRYPNRLNIVTEPTVQFG